MNLYWRSKFLPAFRLLVLRIYLVQIVLEKAVLLLQFFPRCAGVGIFAEVGETAGIDDALVKTVVKIIAVGYLVEFSAGILSDFGQNSVADKLIFAGKIVILVLSIPILESVLSLVGALIGFI